MVPLSLPSVGAFPFEAASTRTGEQDMEARLIQCPGCGARLRVRGSLEGKSLDCPRCQRPLLRKRPPAAEKSAPGRPKRGKAAVPGSRAAGRSGSAARSGPNRGLKSKPRAPGPAAQRADRQGSRRHHHPAFERAKERHGPLKIWKGLSTPLKALVIGAPVLLLLLGAAIAWYRGSQAALQEEEHRKELEVAASDALETLRKACVLEGNAVAEAEACWASLRESLAAGRAPPGLGDSPPTEELLAASLREARSPSLKASSEELLTRLTAESRRLIEDAAEQLGVSEADFLLDLLTARGYRHLRTLRRIREQPARFTYMDPGTARSFFEGVAVDPSPAAGANVLTAEDTVMKLRLFGANIHASYEKPPAAVVDEGVSSVTLQSNFHVLERPDAAQPETFTVPVEKSGQEYLVDFSDAVRNYLQGDNRSDWRLLAAGPLPKGSGDAAGGREGEPTGEGTDLPDLVERLLPGVPLIVAGNGTGSGFLVASGSRAIVITNLHVILDAHEQISIRFYKKDATGLASLRYSTEVDASDCLVHESADLAMLPLDGFKTVEELREDGVTPLDLAPADYVAKPLQSVIVIGHPADRSGVYTNTTVEGKVTAPVRLVGKEKIRFLQVDAPVNPGNSGGPIFNLAGDVIGVATMVIGRGLSSEVIREGMNLGLQVRYVHELLGASAISLAERRSRMAEKTPLVQKMREAQDQLEERGFDEVHAEATFTAKVPPNDEKKHPLGLTPGREYAIWVVVMDLETMEPARVEVTIAGKRHEPRLAIGKLPVGAVFYVTATQPDEYSITLKNPAEKEVSVQVLGYRE